jgi:hypothetical protein
MMTRILVLSALLVVAAQEALGCFCFEVRPFCRFPPDSSHERAAVFVGTVKDIYPVATRQAYVQLMGPVPVAQGSAAASFEDFKSRLLMVWQGIFSRSEEESVGRARSRRDLRMPLKGVFSQMPIRISLDVVEAFVGARSGEPFEVFAGVGADCDVEFKTGQTLLVDASRSPLSGRWVVPSCSRTGDIRSADADLRALRAWKNGKPFDEPCTN